MKLALIMLLAAQVNAAEVICPAKWAPTPEWTQRGAAPGVHVSYVGVMVGAIESNGELRGDERDIKGGYEVRFRSLNAFVDPVQKWAFCSYGNGDARLIRRLPDGTAECVATFRKRPASASVNCR